MEILADMHVHSVFSVDGKDDLVTMCRAAIKKGLKYICFTEHFDMNPKDLGYGYFNFEKFSQAIDSAKGEFRDNLCILKGLEFSEPHLYPKEFESMLKKDFDVILGSVHWVGEDIVKEELEKKFSKEQIFEKYYIEILKAVKFGGFDALAHLDFPKRYLKVSYDLDLTDEILNELSKSGIALEINTSPLRKGLNECSPDKELLRKYTEAGGQKIVVGSDAHFFSNIGAGFKYVQDLIKGNNKVKLGIFQKHRFLEIIGGQKWKYSTI